MQRIKFPPKNSKTFNKLNIAFVEKRRELLDEYYQRVLTIEHIADFTKHHASPVLKAFLDVDAKLGGYRASPAARGDFGSSGNVGGYDSVSGLVKTLS